MKVLMVNTPASTRYRGGDTVQMQKTAERLPELGVEVGESFEREPDASGFDLAHVFNLRTIDVTPGQVRSLRRSGVPVVISPIYLNPSLALWALKAVPMIFSQARSPGELDDLLDNLRRYRVRVASPEGKEMSAFGQNRPRAGYDQVQLETLTEIAHILPNSLLEMNQLVKTLRFSGRFPYTVVPYGADPRTFLDPDPEPFVRKYGLRDFVLQVGRLENSKNQLMTAYALRDAGLPLVLIGGQRNPDYVAQCRKYGPEGMTIIPHLSVDELASAYAAARVHVLPSWVETCGLVSMEAALADCNLVVSTAGYELEYYRDLAYYCDPADVASIREAVIDAYENHDQDAPRREALKQLILSEYSWERAAKICHGAYNEVLERT